MQKGNAITVLGLVAIVIVASVFSLWVVTRVSVPEDVTSKLNSDLINRIQLGDWNTKHDCIIACTSPENLQTVLDFIPSESIESIWESFDMCQAVLTPDQIFDLARMDEVRLIDLNSYQIVI